jgi:hypothetical protein
MHTARAAQDHDRATRTPAARSPRAKLSTALLLASVAGLASAAACSGKHGPPAPASGAGGGGGDDGALGASVSATTGPPPADAGGLCGNEPHQIVFDAPNIYFVLDASGSMATSAGTAATRYQLVRKAALDMIWKLGPLIRVGAALFPLGADKVDGCRPGREVLPMRAGNPVAGTSGAASYAFAAVTSITPFGGTPTTATLDALYPSVSALGKNTIVVLATDGGPNCNPFATCTAAGCMPNIEGRCGGPVNCCAPNGVAGPTQCLDRDAVTLAISRYAAAGIAVYVVGIPGSELYGDVLDDMAIAGGAPQIAPPFYYKVTDLGALGSVLGSIAAAHVPCSFTLAEPPEDPGFTNVYLDAAVIPLDPKDGWSWQSPSVVALHGAACEKLRSGAATKVQIVSGCPTEIPR